MGGESQNGRAAWWETSYLGKMLCLRWQEDAREGEDFAIIYWPIRDLNKGKMGRETERKPFLSDLLERRV